MTDSLTGFDFIQANNFAVLNITNFTLSAISADLTIEMATIFKISNSPLFLSLMLLK